MRAAVYHGARDVRVERLPRPRPGPGEVLLRVLRSGMCGTDATEWAAGPRTFPVARRHPVTGHLGPMVLGHEFVGEVVEAGDGALTPVGAVVASGAGVSCGRCDRCRQGRTNLCRSLLHARAQHRRRDGRVRRRAGVDPGVGAGGAAGRRGRAGPAARGRPARGPPLRRRRREPGRADRGRRHRHIRARRAAASRRGRPHRRRLPRLAAGAGGPARRDPGGRRPEATSRPPSARRAPTW